MKTPKLACVACCLVAFVGCQTPSQQAPPTRTIPISCNLPTITAMPETKEAQEKGGVEIAVVPALYKSEKKNKSVLAQARPPFAALLLNPDSKNQVYVVETTTAYLEPEPKRLQFTVRVNNKLPRVFRGQGAVVQINVAGKMIPFGNLDYKEFIDGIVPPRNEAEFNIYGPALSSLPEKGTIGIFLYDVVTATDTAGNVTDKQNYEWYFDYSTKRVEETAAIQTRQGFIDVLAYQQAMMRQQRGQQGQ